MKLPIVRAAQCGLLLMPPGAAATGAGPPEGTGILVAVIFAGALVVFALIFLVIWAFVGAVTRKAIDTRESPETDRELSTGSSLPGGLKVLAAGHYVLAFLYGFWAFLFLVFNSSDEWQTYYVIGFRGLFAMGLIAVAVGFQARSFTYGLQGGIALSVAALINFGLLLMVSPGPLLGDMFALLYGIALSCLLLAKYRNVFDRTKPTIVS